MSCRCGRRNNDTENAPLAQLVEHLTLNQGVQGSNPWRCTCEVDVTQVFTISQTI